MEKGKNVGKPELAEKVAKFMDCPKAQATKFLDAFKESLKESISKQEKISWTGVMKVEVKERSARTGRNPQTGKSIEIPAKNMVSISVGKELKDTAEASK